MTEFCAKCNKEIAKPLHAMGEKYWFTDLPYLCESCYQDWYIFWIEKSEPTRRWKELFEQWLGYEWDNRHFWSVS